MASTSNVQVTISLQDPDLDDEGLQAEVENLLSQIKDVDGLEKEHLVAVEEAPPGSKALGGFLVGMLTAEVNPANIKALFRFLSDRISGKTIEMEVEANGKKLKVKASSQAEFEFVMQQAQEFLKKA